MKKKTLELVKQPKFIHCPTAATFNRKHFVRSGNK